MVLHSAQHVFGNVFQRTRSRSVSYRDDSLFLIRVIWRASGQSSFHILSVNGSLSVPEDGGAVPVNVLLSSVQRLVALSARSGTGLAEGETGQAKPDWPA
ncbi:hypothetical protein Q502_10825 [Mesotoga sp. Brook.08.YT.4.2.5.2.]|nr:hypothetical protein M388_11140 [Mesotoga sp. Brook.08.YT.4.2.5.4.]RDI91501.1 hypothetical protein Q502_10825 [Mesotoga sp. Brook.08.YT.4.2.5.2.]